MGVKPGYKQTDVGVVPVDWEVKLLPDVCRFRSGKAHEQHISENGRYVCVNSKFISSRGTIRKYSTANFCPAKKDDVLMVMSDLPNGRALAKAYLADADDTYAVNQRVCALTAYRDLPAYLYYVLNRNKYFLKFDDGVNQTHLLNPVFHKCPIQIPPTVEEQRTIATALSDVDALLEGLDRLIAKKRDLKQAAMQQLLTGQTRLPGFEGEWDVMPLENIADVRSGGTPSTTNREFWNGGVPWCTPTDITALNGRKYLLGTERTISHKGLHASSAEVIPPNSIIMTTRATIGECAINKTPMTTNQGFKNLIPFRADTEFLYYLMTAQKHLLIQLCAGSTFLEVGKKQLQAFELVLPSDIEEQCAIAAVLSDMDAEIEALEQRRAKTAALKQAMMQELLTGRTRLVKPQVAEVAHG